MHSFAPQTRMMASFGMKAILRSATHQTSSSTLAGDPMMESQERRLTRPDAPDDVPPQTRHSMVMPFTLSTSPAQPTSSNARP